MSAPASMLAAELVRPGHVELREAPRPEPGPGELVVRTDVALTCGTDLKTFRRGHPRIPLPTPMGHELAGTVAAVGAGVTAFHEGDALALVPTAPCGECRLCRRGRESLCPHAVGEMVFGAFAGYVRLPRRLVEANVFARPASMDAVTAAGLEPLACVVHGAGRVRLEEAERIVLLGDGPIALLFLQLARARGAGAVLLAGRHAVRLEAARALGADEVVDVGSGEPDGAAPRGPAGASGTPAGAPASAPGEDLREAVARWTGGVGADLVVECIGTPQTWRQAFDLAATGGQALFYGGCAAGAEVTLDAERLHYGEVDALGAFHYGRADVRRALALLEEGVVRIAPLVTHERPLARLDEALELALSREAIKVAVRP